jgi:hypothetical protein
MIAAQGRHALLGPIIATPGTQTIAVEEAGNQFIGTDAREHPHGIDRFFRCVTRILAAAPSWYAHLGVNAALPVDHQHDFTRGRIHIDDHFVDERARDALL